MRRRPTDIYLDRAVARSPRAREAAQVLGELEVRVVVHGLRSWVSATALEEGLEGLEAERLQGGVLVEGELAERARDLRGDVGDDVRTAYVPRIMKPPVWCPIRLRGPVDVDVVLEFVGRDR